MGSAWTVTPEQVRVDLEYQGQAFWIELKKGLNTGETKKLETAGFMRGRRVEKAGETEVELNVDWDALVFVKVKTYLIDWSLADDAGKKLVRDIDTLRALKPEVFALIEQAVDDHAKAMSELRLALEKKVPSGENTSERISA